MWFLFFILLMWYIILIDFHMLNHLCIVGMNPTLSWCIISSICCWIPILLRMFALMFIRAIGLKFAFIVGSLSREGNGNPLQYSCLENPWTEEPGRLRPMGLWTVRHDWATSLSLFTFMHWRRKWQPTPVFLPGESPGTREPGGLLSLGSHRVGHNWSHLAAAAAAAVS